MLGGFDIQFDLKGLSVLEKVGLLFENFQFPEALRTRLE